MGGKGSAPPPPDYVGAANAQAAASRELTDVQNFANRPEQYTPFGSSTWSTRAITDPATGQPVTQWTQSTQLAPGLQSALDAQVGTQLGRSQLAGGFMGRVAQEYGQQFPWQNLPERAQLGGPAQLATGTTDYTPGLQTGVQQQDVQRSLAMSDNPALPSFNENYRNQVADTLMQRMVPLHERQQQQLQTQLSNMGHQIGSEGYKRALDELNMRQAAERFNALDTAGSEAQRLYQMQMGARQQAFQEDVGAGGFANQALDLTRIQAMNQAAGQQFGLNERAAAFQNQLRQQAIAEEAQRRGMSLNEMNALLSGQQVSMPTMPSFMGAGRAETPNILGATQMGYDAQLGAYNAQQAQGANMMGGLFSLGSAAMGNPYGLFGFGSGVR
jgi:hypothetical protein